MLKVMVITISVVLAVFSLSVEYAAWVDKLVVEINIKPQNVSGVNEPNPRQLQEVEKLITPFAITDIQNESSSNTTSNSVYQNTQE